MSPCTQCGADFIVTTAERELLLELAPTIGNEKFTIPPPTLCPLCRAQRRYVWRGELHLFKRKSAFSGKPIITFYPPESKVHVFDHDEWWSDSWDPLQYGRDFDFSRPFFPQFKELVQEVPLLSRITQYNGENCEYTNCISHSRNCYLVGGANYNEDCYYGNYVNRSKNCVDCNFVDTCELCYECVDCANCYNLKYSYNSYSCSESYFLNSCRNCQNCFGCVNLVGKQYYFFNEPLSRSEYETKLKELNLTKRSSVLALKAKVEANRLKFPHRYYIGDLNQNSNGNAIRGCKDSTSCFDVSDLWDCHHCHWFHKGKSSMDVVSWGFPAELCYECTEAGDGAYRTLFTVSSCSTHNVMYSYLAMYAKDCFGVVSTKKAQYCILNKQYTKAQYEILVGKIINHMKKTGEWGQFFPVPLSPLCYNTSIAQDYFPLEENMVKSLKWAWHSEEADTVQGGLEEVPDELRDADDSVCGRLFKCSDTGKPYKIIKAELDFYKRNQIPLPSRSFNSRHRLRLKQRNPRQLWDRLCDKCRCSISTSYPPYRPEIIYCQKCYESAVYS